MHGVVKPASRPIEVGEPQLDHLFIRFVGRQAELQKPRSVLPFSEPDGTRTHFTKKAIDELCNVAECAVMIFDRAIPPPHEGSGSADAEEYPEPEWHEVRWAA